MRKSVTCVLFVTLLAMSALTLVPDLSAGEKRGANVIITRSDGSEARGELVAVKPDSFLLLSDGAGVTISLGDMIVLSARIHAAWKARPEFGIIKAWVLHIRRMT